MEKELRNDLMNYYDFMYNPKNVRNCKECPENSGFTEGANGNRLPCGQYNCWVELSVRAFENNG